MASYNIQFCAYNSIPEETPIYMTVKATETEPGVKVSIFRNVHIHKPPAEFEIHNAIVEKISQNLPEEGHRDVAYIQICPPGKQFKKYDKEETKMVVNCKAYENILIAFLNHYKDFQAEVANAKMCGETSKVTEGTISYTGPATIHYMATIEDSPEFTLKVDFCYKPTKDLQTCILFYSFKELETIDLPPQPFMRLALDIQRLRINLKYKEASRKRPRQ